jgi:predicted RNase H-like HicB family nuclease
MVARERDAGVPPAKIPTMHFYNFEIVIEKEPEDDGYFAYSPTLPGCFSNGRTIEETKRNIRDAIRLHIESLLEHGQPIPQNEHLVHVEELTLGVPG